jgi:exonuclease III
LAGLSNALQIKGDVGKRIFCGDLNVLEPDHIPYYHYFKDWEYDFYRNFSKHQLKDAFRHLHPEAQEHSWFGHSGDGYRYDHCFISTNLLDSLQKCYYLHEPRETRLSDHSAMILELNFEQN